MAKVGFARVSTVEQDLTSQLEALNAAGCDKIIHGKQSGASNENERQLALLIDYVRAGDAVLVTKLDRLGRSLKQILATIENIHAKQATLRTLDNVIDTSNDSPLSSAVINLIGTFAQLERDLIISRTAEGRARAIAAGRKMGPKPKISDETKVEIRKQLVKKQSVKSIAEEHRISRTSVQRIRDGKQ
jgi:DNA invertase Pin-like site-specific DNA recombinase